MRIQKALLSTIPILLMSAACGEDRTPTGLGPHAARFDVVSTTTVSSDCQGLITALIAQTQTSPVTTKNRDRDINGLVKILSDANALLGAGKNADAAVKLANYVTKVEQLAAAGNLDTASADGLIAEANAAITCINAIGA